jgi:CRISPR-associated protein Csm2
MGDWKTQLGKHPSSSGTVGGSVKKCGCGKTINNPKFDKCYDCSQRQQTGGSTAGFSSGLASDYLETGYFDAKGNLHARYVAKDGDADLIAKELGNAKPAMTNHQLRRFYAHVRAADNRLRMTGNFSSVYIDLKKLEPFVAEAKGKGKIPDLFYSFMNKNLHTVKTESDFVHGFMEHFQAVVAFFTFHHPKK